MAAKLPPRRRSEQKVVEGQIGKSSKKIPERYKRVNTPIKLTDVLYAGAVFVSLLASVLQREESSKLMPQQLVWLEAAGISCFAVAAACIATVLRKGYVNDILVGTMIFSLIPAFFWMITFFYESLAISGPETVCNTGAISSVFQSTVLANATFCFVLFLFSGLY